LLLAVSACSMLVSEMIGRRSGTGQAGIAARAEQNLQRLEKKMMHSLEEASAISSDSALHNYFIHHGIQDLGFSFFSIGKEKISRWSDNETEISERTADTAKTHSLIRLNNGWYEIFIHHAADKEIAGLLLIRKEYAYENQYLENKFNTQLGLPDNALLAAGGGENVYPVHSLEGTTLFSVRFAASPGDPAPFHFTSWLYLFAFILFLISVSLVGRILAASSKRLAFLLIPGLALIRAVMIHLRIPDEFYSTALFNPRFYASSFYFNSLGDLLLNAMVFLCMAGILYAVVSGRNSVGEHRKIHLLARVMCMTFIVALAVPLNNLVGGLIMNSRISFDVSNIFGMNGYSITGFFIIAVLLWSYVLIAFAMLRRFFSGFNRKTYIVWMSAGWVIATGLCYLATRSDASLILNAALPSFVAALLLLLYSQARKTEKKISLNFLLSITLLFSAYSSFLIWKLNDRKEKESRKLLAQKLESGRDNLAEYLFEDVGNKIREDPAIPKYFKDTVHVRTQVSQRLMQFYFTGYWNKFNISIYCSGSNGRAFDSHSRIVTDSLWKKMRDDSLETDTMQLHFLNSESGQQQYIAVVPVAGEKKDSLTGSITVLMTPKLFQPDEGFPELFVSRKVAFNKELNKYSYARYRNDSLLSQNGPFAYYFSVQAFHPDQQEFSFMDADGYNHLIHHIGDQSYIIVSRSRESFLLPFTLFSYLFTVFSLLLVPFYLVWLFTNKERRYQLSLTRRIQSSVMLLVILSFVLISSGTVYYITHRYDVNKDDSISEKISTLMPMLEKEFGESANLHTRLGDESHASLIQLSGIAKADFNLFNSEGNLLYSSQPKIFDQGIISQRMNPEALYEMSTKGKTRYIHPESIGNLRYIAAYEPFRNRQGKMIGYLHLPYFEKQNELNNEISDFLAALINIYVLLLALAVLATLFIASRITQPLSLI